MSNQTFTNQAWRYINFVADKTLQDEACVDDDVSTSGAVYFIVFAILATAAFLTTLFLLTRINKNAKLDAGKFMWSPWTSTIMLIPVTFFALGTEIGGFGIDCRLGCGSYAAYGSNISYIAGNLSTNVYVCLFIVLVLMPAFFLLQTDLIRKQRVNAASEEGSFRLDSQYRAAEGCERMLMFGFVIMSITGMVPTEALVCDPWLQQSHGDYCYSSGGYWAQTFVHGIGINVGVFIFLIFGTIRVKLAIGQHPDYGTWKGSLSNINSLKALLWMGLVMGYSAAVHFIIWLVVTNGAGMLVVEHNAPLSELCILYKTRDACVGGQLTQKQQNFFGDNYRCRWNEEAKFGTPPCILDQCGKDGIIDKNRVGIVGEFLGFMYFSLGASILLVWIHQVEQQAFQMNLAKSKQEKTKTVDGS